MGVQERIYRVLLLAYPRQHRREYGEAMAQLMRDRVREVGGGVRTLLLWASLLADLARSAMVERVAVVRAGFLTGWWRAAAVAVAAVLAFAGVSSLFDPATGPWYKYTFGRLALLAAPLAIVTGLFLPARYRRQGSTLVAVGSLPGAAAIALFWSPPFLLFGLFSIAVMIGAFNDAENARRIAATATEPAGDAVLATDAWSPPSNGRREGSV
jgi:hypothetical protein